jgi:hypothetical protein
MTSIDPTDPAAPIDAIGPHTIELGPWRRRLIRFQRVAGGFMIFKGLTHWTSLLGFGDGPASRFQQQPLDGQAATVFFAVIDLVAAVGLWLAAAWGAVIWLTAGVSMAAVEVFFPQVYGGRWMVVAIEGALLFSYLFLAIQSAREHPN